MDFGVIGSHNEKSLARHLNTTKSIYMITVTNILAGVKKKSEVSAKHGMLMWHTIDSDAVLQYLKTKNTPTNCGCVFP